jgi:hypothetical protein
VPHFVKRCFTDSGPDFPLPRRETVDAKVYPRHANSLFHVTFLHRYNFRSALTPGPA